MTPVFKCDEGTKHRLMRREPETIMSDLIHETATGGNASSNDESGFGLSPVHPRSFHREHLGRQ
jgi:hypothetical protein